MSARDWQPAELQEIVAATQVLLADVILGELAMTYMVFEDGISQRYSDAEIQDALKTCLRRGAAALS